jgi:protein SCO1/2
VKRALIALAVLVVLAGGVLAGVLLSRPYSFHGTVIESPAPSHDFTLMSATGPVSLSDFRGKIVALYFGYTFCPDVCPTTMSDLAEAMRILGDKADDVQVIMVSVDPARDTPELLDAYVKTFDPDFIGLTGSEQDIATVAGEYGVFYQKHEGTAATGYLIDHSAFTMVLDREGRLALILDFGTPPADIASDLSHLLKQ